MAAAEKPVSDTVIHTSYSHTTYNDTYRPQRTLPPIKFREPPSVKVPEVQYVKTRKFPLEPFGPHRPHDNSRALAIGLGEPYSHKHEELKPIIQTQPPSKVINEPVKWHRKKTVHSSQPQRVTPPRRGHELFNIGKDVVDDICKNFSWSSVTERANQEAVVPMTHVVPPVKTYEENSDMVKYRPRRYEDSANLWQSLASDHQWERTLSRNHTERWNSDSYIPGSKPGRWPSISQTHRSDAVPQIIVDRRINELVRSNEIDSVHDRPYPGYAGYVPLSAVDLPLQKKSLDPFTSVTKTSYRQFPASQYRVTKYAHQGPLSQHVTLTSPYNPFNKMRRASEEESVRNSSHSYVLPT